jgi:hypothetical protein
MTNFHDSRVNVYDSTARVNFYHSMLTSTPKLRPNPFRVSIKDFRMAIWDSRMILYRVQGRSYFNKREGSGSGPSTSAVSHTDVYLEILNRQLKHRQSCIWQVGYSRLQDTFLLDNASFIFGSAKDIYEYFINGVFLHFPWPCRFLCQNKCEKLPFLEVKLIFPEEENIWLKNLKFRLILICESISVTKCKKCNI